MKNKYSNFVLKNIQKFKTSFKRTNEGGILIRYKRLRKFRKSTSFNLAIKVLVFWYSCVYITSNLSTPTNAVFIDQLSNEDNLLAANWEWDKSSLSFYEEDDLKNGEELREFYGFSCNEGFYSWITRGNNPMAGPTLYRVFYRSTDEPNKNKTGDMVFEEALYPMEELKEKLIFLPEDGIEVAPGYYKFAALQRPGHQGGRGGNIDSATGRFQIWGELAIHVTEEQLKACNKWDVPNGSISSSAEFTDTNSKETTDSKKVEDQTEPKTDLETKTEDLTQINESETLDNENEVNTKENDVVRNEEEASEEVVDDGKSASNNDDAESTSNTDDVESTSNNE